MRWLWFPRVVGITWLGLAGGLLREVVEGYVHGSWLFFATGVATMLVAIWLFANDMVDEVDDPCLELPEYRGFKRKPSFGLGMPIHLSELRELCAGVPYDEILTNSEGAVRGELPKILENSFGELHVNGDIQANVGTDA